MVWNLKPQKLIPESNYEGSHWSKFQSTTVLASQTACGKWDWGGHFDLDYVSHTVQSPTELRHLVALNLFNSDNDIATPNESTDSLTFGVMAWSVILSALIMRASWYTMENLCGPPSPQRNPDVISIWRHNSGGHIDDGIRAVTFCSVDLLLHSM